MDNRQGWRNLCATIINQAANDYMENKASKEEIRNFVCSKWFVIVCEAGGLNAPYVRTAFVEKSFQDYRYKVVTIKGERVKVKNYIGPKRSAEEYSLKDLCKRFNPEISHCCLHERVNRGMTYEQALFFDRKKDKKLAK